MIENTDLSSTDPNMRTVKLSKGQKNTQVDVVRSEPSTTAVAIAKPIETQASKKTVQPQPSIRRPRSKRVDEETSMLRMRCKQLCVSAFFQEDTTIRSLGFTSAIHGEGKSFITRLAAEVMAEENNIPVTLLECNWEHPSLSNSFNLSPTPGLAEWLSGDCSLEAIRQSVNSNLTVIPAGDGKDDPIRLLQEFRQRGVLDVLTRPGEVLLVDLPSVVTTAYGQMAARLFDSLILVVRMGVTSEDFVIEACQLLKASPVQGVVLNQIHSRVPRWLRQIL